MKHGNNPETAAAFVNYEEMQGSNLYSFGDIIKSYNTIIATHFGGVILLNNRDYSHTTQRHKLHIIRAARNLDVFEVPNIYRWNGLNKDDHRTNFEYLREEAQEAYKKSTRAKTDRTRIFWTEETKRRTETARRYRDIFEVTAE
jgi:hypothetical protein